MDLTLSLKLAFRALMRNPLRATLTMLGVIIGVAAVVATLAIGQGARASVQAQIATLGSNVIMIMPGAPSAGGVRMVMGSGSTFTAEDVDAIRRECPSVSAVTWTVRSGGQAVYGNQNWSTSIVGATADYFPIREWTIADGTAFTDGDVRNAAKVAVLGATVAENLFQGGRAIGETIRIKNLPFKVVAVMNRKGGSMMGQDQDDLIILPGTTVQRKFLGTTSVIGVMMASARGAESINAAIEEMSSLLRQRHRIRPGQDDDFFMRNQAEFANAAEQTSKTMTLLLSSIALVSLLVGGIGIMNIMLVSVTERTREIGIRMAVGAKGGDILSQFLVESAFLSLVGGALGVALGWAASSLISRLAGWPTTVSPASIALAFGFSAAVGIFFGFYPARKAALQDPIEALRYE